MASIPCAYGYLHLAVKFFPNQAKRSLQKKKVSQGNEEKRKVPGNSLNAIRTQVQTNKNKTFIAPAA